jgi:hypothetical protein
MKNAREIVVVWWIFVSSPYFVFGTIVDEGQYNTNHNLREKQE